jgi:serine/threonine protein kinase
LERFALEHRALAALQHPNVVALLGAESLDDGRPCIILEAVQGEHLDQACARCAGVREVLALFLQLCAAVRHAHENLIVHRDLKPSNVRVEPQDKVKVLDFGLLKLLAPNPNDSVTHPGLLAPLTPRYASPEQWNGAAITARADSFSLGIMLVELLHRFEPSPDSDLDLICRKAAASLPEERYSSVQGLADDLERHLVGQPVRVRRPSRGIRACDFCAASASPLAPLLR